MTSVQLIRVHDFRVVEFYKYQPSPQVHPLLSGHCHREPAVQINIREPTVYGFVIQDGEEPRITWSSYLVILSQPAAARN